jgi:hypothetical protein
MAMFWGRSRQRPGAAGNCRTVFRSPPGYKGSPVFFHMERNQALSQETKSMKTLAIATFCLLV